MKKYIITLLLTAFILPLASQQTISFQTDVGLLSKINYQSATISTQDKNNIHFGVNYTYFVSPKLAVETGVGLSTYTTNVMLPERYTDTANEVDSFGSGFQFITTAVKYTEAQKLYMATIPVRLRFEDALTPNGINIYASGGVKFMLPISQEANVSANSVTTTGYYPNNQLVIKDIPKHGFTTHNNVNTTVNMAYKLSLALSAELGVKLRLENYDFYFGGFLDYGLTDIRKNEGANSNVIAYIDGDAPIQPNGISTLKGIEKVNLIAFGLQLRFPLYTLK